MDDFLEILSIEHAKTIFVPKQNNIYVPKLIIPIGQRLLDITSKNPNYLFRMRSSDFEEFIAELFRKEGFDVELTKKTRDGGRILL